MSRRFVYRRMTPERFAEALAQHDLKPEAFGRLFGVPPSKVDKWSRGVMEIPYWVTTVLTLLTLPGAYSLVRELAHHEIVEDRQDQPGGRA